MTHRASDLTDKFMVALSGDFGPRRFSTAVRLTLPELVAARGDGASWSQIALLLNSALSQCEVPPVDTDTVRGVIGREMKKTTGEPPFRNRTRDFIPRSTPPNAFPEEAFSARQPTELSTEKQDSDLAGESKRGKSPILKRAQKALATENEIRRIESE